MIDTKCLTPMMQQYMETKKQYSDCILFYRLGDFYEMFFDDAITASKELEITLTGKNCGLEERAPMCGVPYHSVDSYLNRLVEKGYKVAICEQVEDPQQAKGIVKREVVRVVTAGTNMNAQALDETKNNYIMCIVYIADRYGLAVADVSTGDYFVTELDSGRKLLDEIHKFSPSEIICNESFYMSGLDLDDLRHRLGMMIYSIDTHFFDDEMCARILKEHFHAASLEGMGLGDYNCGVIAAGALLKYLYETQKTSLSHITHITGYATGRYMLLDSSSRRNLELCETLREKQKRGSLLWVLDKTKTAMGARMLRSYIEQPLIDRHEIEQRLEAVEELKDKAISREEIREYLSPVYDLERLISRVTYQSANPRDLISFRNSLEMLPHIKYILTEMHEELLQRFITPRLKELEDTILGAEDKLYALEYTLYCKVRDRIASEVLRVQKTAKAVAKIDVFTSLALVAERNNFVRPKINEKGLIDIKGGRHPVVEKMTPDNMFIANDTLLDDKKNRVSIITGPNMAGKSTYMRQSALIVLMAQIGSFVPADSANIGICDRIFTRVGASDDLASGQSTFMVEMTEVANILRNATSSSLLILDEIGRGTSTFDGLSIAWAVVEHISNKKLLGAKTLFATHYHELTELEGKLDSVNNYCIAVKEQGDDIVFLRKIVKGGADKSYGIQVAKLAGVPESVIARAKEIVGELSEADITTKVREISAQGSETKARQKKYDEVDLAQISLFDTVKDDDVLEELKEIDVSNLTPMDALNTIYRLQNKLKNRYAKYSSLRSGYDR